MYSLIDASALGLLELMMNYLILQTAREALSGRIGIAVPFERRGSLHAELGYQFPVFVSAVLHTTVRLADQARSPALTVHCALQGLHSQILVMRDPIAYPTSSQVKTSFTPAR